MVHWGTWFLLTGQSKAMAKNERTERKESDHCRRSVCLFLLRVTPTSGTVAFTSRQGSRPHSYSSLEGRSCFGRHEDTGQVVESVSSFHSHIPQPREGRDLESLTGAS